MVLSIEWERELEEGDEEAEVNILKDTIANTLHSYKVIRETTPLNLTDEEFDELILKHPKVFKKVKVRAHDEEGNRIPGGLPGVKLRKAESGPDAIG